MVKLRQENLRTRAGLPLWHPLWPPAVVSRCGLLLYPLAGRGLCSGIVECGANWGFMAFFNSVGACYEYKMNAGPLAAWKGIRGCRSSQAITGFSDAPAHHAYRFECGLNVSGCVRL